MAKTWPLLLILFLTGPLLRTQSSQGFQRLAQFSAPGGIFAATTGPGPAQGEERLYATYMYFDKTFDLVAVDPRKGESKTFPNPVPGEYGARCMVVGPDHNLYLGTIPNAHLLKFDVGKEAFQDLGRPSVTETYIWSMAVGADRKLYLGTSPHAQLIRFDPATGRSDTVGRADPDEEYLRYLATGSDGYVYGGIGQARMEVLAYNTATGALAEILPTQYQGPGAVTVYHADDGQVYAVAGSHKFRLQGGTAIPIAPETCPPDHIRTRLRDGSVGMLKGSRLEIRDKSLPNQSPAVRDIHYHGRPMSLYRLGLGPDGQIYLSTVLPSRLLRFDSNANALQDLGELGDGEIYSFLAQGGTLVMGGYATAAPILDFDPDKPLDPARHNPLKVAVENVDPSWRPMAATAGPSGDGLVYVGGRAGYGKLGGNLVVLDPRSGHAVAYPSPIPEESVYCLATYGNLILGGTGIYGGLGITPTQSTAQLFLWDPSNQRLVWHDAPVPGIPAIDNLLVGPGGRAFCIAGNKFFVYDLSRKTVLVTRNLPFPGGTIYGSLAMGPDRRIWGLAGHPAAGVFCIDPSTYQVTLMGKPPAPITGGFALQGRFIYLICGDTLYRYAIPRP